MATKAIGSNPSYQGVCERHGKEDQCVTSGGLIESPLKQGVSKPISPQSERASEALRVVGERNSTLSAGTTCVTRKRADRSGLGKDVHEWVE